MPNPAAPGRVLNERYRLVSQLARGGMATVWVAEDTLLARKVAVKTLHPELSVEEAVRARFRNEAIAAAALAHPGIVTTYDTGEDDGVAYIVMELVEGPNLRRLLDEHGPLPPGDAIRIARGVANALEEAHRRGIVHRDVKPANVLVPLDGPVKVTDFGIAKAADSGDLTSSGTIIGTARYLAPEQVRGEPADGRADIYGVGLLLHEMIAGSLPFRGDTEMATAMARLTNPPAPLPAGTPAPVVAIVARCLALDPDDRWPTAHALATALDVAAKGGEVEGPPVRTPPPVTGGYGTRGPAPKPAAQRQPARQPRRRKRAVWPWAILGGLLLGAGAGGGYLLVDDLSKEKRSDNGSTNTVVEMVRAQDFDPEGTDPQQENRELAPLAIDGSATTAWRTERYSTPDLGGGKSGVGIYVELSGATDISFVEVDTQASGWSAQIYVADEPGTTLPDWGAPVADGEDLGTAASFDLDRQGGAVLIWITRLPDSGQLEVSEIRIG